MVAKTSKTSNTSKTTKTKKAVVESTPVEVEPETTPIDTTPIEVEPAPVAKPAKTKSTKSSKTTKSAAPAPAQPAAAPSKTTKSAKSAAPAPTPKKAKAAKKSEPVEEEEDEPVESKPAKGEKPKGEKTKRAFKVVNVVDHDLDESTSKNGGRYNGLGPMQASKKAFGHLAKKLYGNEPCTIVFSIQECTQGSDKKVYPYTGERFKLETPQVINKGGNEYNISFKNVVKSVKPVKNQ